ncbi:hypothetical protein BKA62DRAFT_660766, partial [Auriculariales sp. MPI-PUGE-AT-0066]
MSYIGGITVVYGDNINQKPSNAISEINSNDPDINKGFKGKFVWLVPEWTSNPTKAVGNFEIVISDLEISGMQDLSKGAGGKYRYLRPYRDNHRAIEIGLLRLRTIKMTKPYGGWDAITTDINEGRGGDFLYILLRWE